MNRDVIFQIEDAKHVAMSTYHLQDKGLTLSAKGLLSIILSFPADTDFSLDILSSITKESAEEMKPYFSELEQKGYVLKRNRRNGGGADEEYLVFETPYGQ